MGRFSDALDARLPPLPIGRLSARTLHLIGMGRQVHVRTGPWVLLAEDGSQVVRIHGGTPPPRVVRPPRLPDLFGGAEPTAHDRGEPRVGRAPRRAIASGAGVPSSPAGPVAATPVAAGVDTLER